MRLSAMFAFLAAPLALAAPAHAQEARYTITDIGRLPDAFSTVPFAMNNHGEAVGWCQGPGTLLRAFIYRPGEGIGELVPPAGFANSRASDITDTGLVTGSAYNSPANGDRAWILRGGVYELIPTFPDGCTGMVPAAINEAGAVVGRTCPDGGGNARVFYHSDAEGLIDLTALFGAATANDISNAGIVTGGTFDGAYRWSPQTGFELLGTLADPYDSSAHGQGINESNDVAGNSIWGVTGPDLWKAFFFTDGTGIRQIGPESPARVTAYAINEMRTVVGTTGTTSTTDIAAWVWTPGTGHEFLGEIIDDPRFYGFNRAADVNDSGQIFGSGISTDPLEGYSRAVILTPAGLEPPCRADWDGNDAVNSNDFFVFLDDFFGPGGADFDGDGATTSDDFFAFLEAFFKGCA